MKRRFETTCSAEQALEEVFRLIENDDGDDDDVENQIHDDLCELGTDVDFVTDQNNSCEDPSDEEDNVPLRPKYQKKILTQSRIVNSIDKGEDENNYNKWIEPVEEKIITSKLDKETLEFTNLRPVNKGQTRRQNIIKPPIGVLPIAKAAKDPLSASKLFIDDDYLEKLVLYTNLKITGIIHRMKMNGFNFTARLNYMKETTIEELSAFIGLMIYRGMLNLNNHSTKFLFSRGPPMFCATMARDRFHFLTSFISFDIESERRTNYKTDRFAAFREFMEDFNNKCLKQMTPGDYLSLDETLYGMRNQVMFKMYIASKPHKYGLLFKSMNAARYPYTFCAMPYYGKPEDIENSKYYVQGTENAVKYLVDTMRNTSEMDGRNITFDRLYSSIPLARWLYQNNITMIGTIQSNRRGIPDYVKEVKSKEPLTNEIFWLKNDSISLSLIHRKDSFKREKNVLMLSTLDIPLGTTKDDGKNKMALYKLYDFSMGGTDSIDYRCAKYTCKPKSHRWTFVAWFYTLDMIRNNAQTIFSMNNGRNPLKTDSLSFGLDVVDALVKPFIESRSLCGLQSKIIQKMELVLEKK